MLRLAASASSCVLPAGTKPRALQISALRTAPAGSTLSVAKIVPLQVPSPKESTVLRPTTGGRQVCSSTMGSAVPLSTIPKPPLLKAILFDVDGTLADSDPLHYLAFREILQEVGFDGGSPITEEFFRHRISGRHNPDIEKDLFPLWSPEQRANFSLDKEARFRRLSRTDIKEVSGLRHFCDWAKQQGLLRAAVTNAPRENAEQMIEGLGLNGFFHYLVIGSECTRAKPFPDPYLEAMELLGVCPHECFAIEDSPAGMKAAVDAGVATVGILTGQQRNTLMQAGAVFTIKDYQDAELWAHLGVSEPTSERTVSSSL